MSEEAQEMSVEEMTSIMRKIEEEESGRQEPREEGLTRDNPLNLKEFVSTTQLKEDVQFNVNDLDNVVMQHAALFVHYANLARLARRQFENMKAAFEILESRLSHIHRDRLVEEGKKATEAQVEAAVKSDSRWWDGKRRLNDSRAIYDLANDAREAFMQRKDMIVQVSVDRRREREGEMRIGPSMDARERAMHGAGTASETMKQMVANL